MYHLQVLFPSMSFSSTTELETIHLLHLLPFSNKSYAYVISSLNDTWNIWIIMDLSFGHPFHTNDINFCNTIFLSAPPHSNQSPTQRIQGVKYLEHEADHSLLCSAEVKNVCLHVCFKHRENFTFISCIIISISFEQMRSIHNTLPIAIMPSSWILSAFLHTIRSPSSSTLTPQFVPESEDSMLSGYLNEKLETTSDKTKTKL